MERLNRATCKLDGLMPVPVRTINESLFAYVQSRKSWERKSIKLLYHRNLYKVSEGGGLQA